jgi:hypothetical protein
VAGSRARGGQAKAIGDQLRGGVATIVKATALGIDAGLRAAPSQGGTPVATGHARANWVPSVTQPHEGETNGEGAHAAGLAEVLGYELGDGAVYISNSAGYVERLNRGSSKQAPALFIEAVIDRVLAEMQQRYGARAVSLERFQGEVGGAGAANLASAYSPFGDD